LSLRNANAEVVVELGRETDRLANDRSQSTWLPSRGIEYEYAIGVPDIGKECVSL
jgi:hypothetical protein